MHGHNSLRAGTWLAFPRLVYSNDSEAILILLVQVLTAAPEQFPLALDVEQLDDAVLRPVPHGGLLHLQDEL